MIPLKPKFTHFEEVTLQYGEVKITARRRDGGNWELADNCDCKYGCTRKCCWPWLRKSGSLTQVLKDLDSRFWDDPKEET
jgi:hypothetical protein